MTKKAAILICFLLCTLLYAKAQQITLEGTVISRKQVPVEFANVCIMNTDSTIMAGGASTETGHFAIKAIPKGDCILSVSCLGFKNQTLLIKAIEHSIDVGEIILEEADETLNEVVITAKSQINKLEKTLIYPTEHQTKHSSDGFTLLHHMMIPQIDVDLLKKQVSSKGNTVTLLLNGRPVADYNEITVLRPKDIIRIEFHEMPTGSLAEYESVINYITHQSPLGGYIVATGTQQMAYGEGDYLVMARLNHGNSEQSLGYAFEYYNDSRIRRDVSETFTYPNENLLYRKEESLPSVKKNHTHHFFYNYNNRTDKLQTNLKMGYKSNVTPRNEFNSILSYRGANEYSKQLKDNSNESQSNPYLSFYTDLKMKNQQSLFIRANIDYSKNIYNRYYQETEKNMQPNSLQSDTDEDYWSTIVGAIYTKGFSKGREISLNFHNYTNISSSSYKNEKSTNKERLVSSESLYLLNLSKKWKKTYLSIRLGMSSLLYSQKDKENKRFWSYRPGITLRYILNERNTIQYRGALNNSFPTLDLFTDAEQNIDFIQKRRGNPLLKIVQIFSNKISYSYTSKQFTLNLSVDQFYSNPNTARKVIYENDYFIHSYTNDGTYNFINPEIGISIKSPNNLLNLKVTGGLNRYIITGSNGLRSNDWYINPSFMLFWKNMNLNIYYYSSREGVYAGLDHWSTDGRYGLTLSYNKENISLTMGTQNPFSKYERTNKIKLDIYSSQSVSYNRQNDHLFYVKLSYNFNFGHKHEFSEISTGKYTNSGIIKGSKE